MRIDRLFGLPTAKVGHSAADETHDGTQTRGTAESGGDREEAGDMRIPPETIRSLVGLHAHRVSKTGAVGANGKVSAPRRLLSADAVSLSDEASLLNALKQGVKAMPDVDEQKVQAVRDELAGGRFEINPRQVAASAVLEIVGEW